MPSPSLPVRQRSQIVLFRTLLLSHSRVQLAVKALLAERCGLSAMQFDMVAELGGQPPMRMGDLGKKMITSPSSVTRVAQSLEAMGLVVRQRDEQSERVVLARLTPEGDAFFAEHFAGVAAAIAKLFNSKLAVEEQRQLTGLLAKLADVESE